MQYLKIFCGHQNQTPKKPWLYVYPISDIQYFLKYCIFYLIYFTFKKSFFATSDDKTVQFILA